MTLWRYEAIAPPGPPEPPESPESPESPEFPVPPARTGATNAAPAISAHRSAATTRRASVRRGEVTADTAAEARAALRSAGLQVLSVRADPASARKVDTGPERRAAKGSTPTENDAIARWLRSRRVQARADALDAISMLLESGIPLLQALETLSADEGGDLNPRLRRALVHVREDVRSGMRLSAALAAHPGWFDPAEIALIDAAESGGGIAPALQQLSERHSSSARLTQRLVGALTYPGIVAAVGVGVSLFLAMSTLPQLAAVLKASRVEVPGLTLAVMAVGQFTVRWGGVVVLALVALTALLVIANRAGQGLFGSRLRITIPVPLVVRRLAVARASSLIAELLHAGIPLVDAMRLAAPAHRGLTAGLGAALLAAAKRIEQGADVVSALGAHRTDNDSASAGDRSTRTGGSAPGGQLPGVWFEREFLQLVAVGEASGELAPVLERLAKRYERQSARLIDRLASLLEPATIILLAVFVGTVVVAAVLPLVKLQEVL